MRVRAMFVTAVCAVLLFTVAGNPVPAAADSQTHRHGTRRAAVVSGTAATTAVDPLPNNTPTGFDISVRLLPGVKAIFDHVSQGGLTTADKTDLAPGVRLSPCGTKIPPYLTVPVGDDHFVGYRIETNAGFENSVDLSIVHPDSNSRLFRAKCPPPAIDPGWEDLTISTAAGDPRGRHPQFSQFIGVDDLRSIASVLNSTFSALKSKVAPGSPASQVIDAATLTSLQNQVDIVGNAITASDFPAAIADLRNFIRFVRAGAGSTIPDTASAPGGNIAGFLEAKASTLIFSVSLL